MSALAHGPSRAGWEARPDLSATRSERLARVRAAMREGGIDALLVYKDENVRYLTGLRAQIITGKSSVLNGCLLRSDGSPILLASGGDLERVRVAMPWIDEIHGIPIMEAAGLIRGAFESTIVPLLRAHDLDGARIGLDECSFAQVQEFGRLLPGVALEDGDAVMQRARLLKSDAELAVMEEAAAIAEAVTESAIAAVAPGVRETEVAGEAMRTLYRLGGEMPHVATPFVASGERMAPPTRLCTDKIIREGDLVFIDIGAMWNGYFADMGRTTVCGAPSRRQREVYTAVHDALAAGMAAMRPGNTNDDVARAIVDVADDRGLASNFISLFIGHGIGIGANEPPYIGENLPGAETVRLETGMTFAVEPLIWVPGERGGAGVRLEDTIVIEDGGARALTRTAFDDRLLI